MSLMVVVEGDTDIPVVRKLAADAELEMASVIDMGGKSMLDKQLGGFNNSARGSPWLVLRDLDRDADCGPSFLAARKFKPSRWMRFRLAVREVESWLLADAKGFSEFIFVSESSFPLDPDQEQDPTVTLVNIARKSTRALIRKALVPKEGATVQVGELYEAKLIEFAQDHWNLARACKRSESLRRARAATRALGARWRASINASSEPNSG